MSNTSPGITLPSGPVGSASSEPVQPPLTAPASTPSSSLEESLLMRMDRAVESFAAVMEDTSMITVGEGTATRQVPRYSFAERYKAAEFCRDWLARRKKLTTVSTEGDAPNIEAMKEAMRAVTLETMERENVVRLPKKKNGRPTKEEAIARRAAEADMKLALAQQHDEDDADDSELRNALRGE